MRFLPAGPSALLIELGDLDAVLGLHAEILRRRALGWAPGLTDVIPAARTILLDGVADPGSLAAEIAGWRVPPAPAADGPAVTIACRYDGEDLAEVAAAWGVSPAEAARMHARARYRVAFCGFMPGFAYLSGLPDELSVRRRPVPRRSVPAGSVAVAGGYTAVYPRSSPGGWMLIGRTGTVMWDPDRDQPALLAPGMRVRFTDET